jgi:hypothetical protein
MIAVTLDPDARTHACRPGFKVIHVSTRQSTSVEEDHRLLQHPRTALPSPSLLKQTKTSLPIAAHSRTLSAH